MITAVIVSLFALTCEDGILNALKLWGFAIGLTAILVGGILLAKQQGYTQQVQCSKTGSQIIEGLPQ